MGQALYRKYRSKKLDEIIGQEHITQTLAKALKAGHISHAYLFTGPRGVGKTSIARILAHEVNGLAYDDDSSHLDIIEIDAASNRRIDEIRDLRDRVHIAPTSAKYKVYIIDEVHMLTREAFNALLKTLEEPPAHVIFILATTEAHKLPGTIISRTQRFAFRPVSFDKVIAHLREIAKAEKIAIDDEALELIAKHGEGSFRDSISLLDQARTIAKHIGIDEVRDMLGLAPDEAVTSLVIQVEDSHSADVVQSLQQLREQGFEAAQLARQLGQIWRSRLLEGQSKLAAVSVLTLMEQLLSVPNSSNPFTLLEITLLEVAMVANPEPVINADVTPEKVSPPVIIEPKSSSEATTEPSAKQTMTVGTASFDKTIWPTLLNTIKGNHNTLYGIVRMATPSFSKDQLRLTFQFAFHQKRVNEASNKKIIGTTLQELTGQTIEVVCELDPKSVKPAPSQKSPKTVVISAEPDSSLQTISNIFGGAELLESEN